ncbi:MAG: aspartyl/glutamyl-tRNA amidotransferase subunit A [Candidatus Melainabacteria bacterium GWF2_37_15]|nr:MAG: aspartyl/glutamyl-tRNA amidotransferase subunit A [Candidatus Melainabacteria bacterium GWF2_37_15]
MHHYKTASELRKLLLKREISAKELLDESYKRIKEVNNKLNSFISLTKDLAYKTAGEVDEKIKINADLPPLAGIPLAIKDNMCVKGTTTTAASNILKNFVPPYDATIVKKLQENLVPIIGKANLDEFAMGSSTETSAFGITRNPWDTNLVPGGSSGGSAVAVASGESVLALGSDTGGSIRLPASFCGIIGMKPTYGRVSRFGLIAYASSLDQIGPFGRCVEDVALTLQAISGHDPMDSTSINQPVPDYTARIKEDIKGLRIGVISEMLGDGINPDVKAVIENAVKTYENLGANIEEISIPHTKYAISTYYVIAMAEASSNLARFDGVRYGYRTPKSESLLEMYTKTRAEGFGEEVKRRIMLGTYALSSGYYDAYYKKAQQVRTLIKKDFDKAFESVDLLLSPVCPVTAFEIGSKTDDPLSMYLMDICTLMANLSGLPGISLPCGFDTKGLPVGMQLLGPVLSEELMLKAAYNFEQATGYHLKHPEL